MTTTYAADIASYQQGLIPAELKPQVAALLIKCTQGSNYVDPDYANWLDEAAATGLIPAAYHYPDNTPAAAQASNLAGHIIDPSLPVMIDTETVGLAQALEVADALASAHLHPKLVYLARTYWSSLGGPELAGPFNARGLKLINASYPSGAAGSPAALYPGDTAPEWDEYGGMPVSLWQFTNSAVLAGQRIDLSAFRGSATQLAALLDTTVPVGTASTGANWPTERPGTANPWVAVMQQAVMLSGADPHGVDGDYGPHTGAALEAAQHAFAVEVDGICGPVTWGSLRARTLTVQKALAAHSYGKGGTDSIAGPATAAEVIAFQAAHALARDGIVGPRTSAALGIATA